MNEPVHIDVYGRALTVERRSGTWLVCFAGTDGTRRPAHELGVPDSMSLPDVPNFLADLCHEWARPGHLDAVARINPVFVYGTLRMGYPNYGRNHGTQRAGQYRTALAFPLMLCGPRASPCMFNEPGEGEQVVGELFDVELAGLAEMDALERIYEDGGYRRHSIDVEHIGVESGSAVLAAVYLKARRHAPGPHVGPLGEFSQDHATLYRPRLST